MDILKIITLKTTKIEAISEKTRGGNLKKMYGN
jgi:hypothetical protein